MPAGKFAGARPGFVFKAGERGLGYRDGDAPQGPASDAEPDVAEAASPADDAAPSAARASGSALPQGFFVTLTTRSSTRMAACVRVISCLFSSLSHWCGTSLSHRIYHTAVPFLTILQVSRNQLRRDSCDVAIVYHYRTHCDVAMVL